MKRTAHLLTLLLSGIAMLSLDAATTGRKGSRNPMPPGITVIRNLVYKEPFRRPLELDLYRPENSSGPLPVVLWVHGGGWKSGSKDNCPASWLAAEGFAVASINYRLLHDAQWPAQIHDCRDAVRWLRTQAALFQLDPDRIGAWGSSAGGHLVAILGTIAPPEGETVSSRVQAVCDWFGPADLLTMPPNIVSADRSPEQVARSNGARLLGAAVREVPELARQASGLHHVSADDPPFLIMHGDQDPGVPLDQSLRLAEALRTAGTDITLQVVKGAGHGGPALRTPEVRDQVLRFFRRTLKP